MIDSSIDLPSGSGCAFCEYLRGSRPFAFVSRGHLVSTLVTREQRGTPHLLVIPNKHRQTILEVTDSEAAALLIEVRDAAFAIDAAYQRPGIAVWQNNGISAHQAIRHVHFHVAGTLDSGGTNWGEVEELPLADAKQIAERVRAHWPSRR
jgi:histidine triad (HIT) family protein